MKFRSALYFISFILISNASLAQSGAHRSGIDWQEIKTPAANIIFAPEMEAKANRVANIVNYMRENNSLSIGPKDHKIDILIRNETIVPNGYVALGPFRSEFFASPPDRFNMIGASDWIEHLAIHEYRHVMQAANEKVGITKLAYYITGQSGWNGLKFLSIPQWVTEGDAVVMETSLTKSGRGRMPYFTRGLRALALEGKNYNYHKWRNGSYDELMPNRYPFGYMLLSHLRNNKGSKVSGDIIRDGASYRTIFYPYSNAMKFKTGWSTTSLYKDAWKHFGDLWRAEVKSLQLTPTKKITKDPKFVTNYYFPQFGKNNQIIALKSSFNQTEKLVNVDGTIDTDITSIGFSYSDYFNYQNGMITWTEFRRNARRTNTQYSNIYTYNSKTKEKSKLTKKGKYFSPTLSSDTKQIVTVHIGTDLVNSLEILDTESGDVNMKFSVVAGASVTRPIFSNGDKSIVYIIKNNNYIWIESMDLISEKITQLSPKSSHIIDAISYNTDHIYFSASYTGIDNIFRVAIDGSQVINQVTSVPIGAYEPSVSDDGKKLIFTEYTTKGQMISTMDLSDARQGSIIQIIEPVDMEWMDKVSTIEEGGEIFSKLPDTTYEKKNYNGLFKGLKLHSWAFSPTSAELIGGLQFNNILDDFSIFAGGGYNQNEERGFYFFNTKVSKYYPVYEFTAETRGRSTLNIIEVDTFINVQIQRFEELNISGDISLPYSWVSGNYFKNLQFGVGVTKHNLYNVTLGEEEMDNNSVTTSHLFFQFSTLHRTAYQNVRPRFGITLNGRYTRDLTNSGESKFIGTSRFYLPGLDYNHSFRLTASYQKEKSLNKYQLSDNFGYPRGYRAPLNDKVYKIGFDYMFPVAYPDVGFIGFMYLKRLRMNIFSDVGQSSWNDFISTYNLIDFNYTNNFHSVGTDLYFDITAYNLVPMSLVIRYSYRMTANFVDEQGGEFRFFSFITF